MASRRRRGKAEESEGEETFEAPATQKPNESESEGSEDGSYYSDEDEEYDDEEYEEGEGADGEYTLEAPVVPNQVQSAPKEAPVPAPAPNNLAAKESEGQLEGEGGEEGEGEGEGEEGQVPPLADDAQKEKEKDPSFVPTLGRFFMHDDRSGGSRRQGYEFLQFHSCNCYIYFSHYI